MKRILFALLLLLIGANAAFAQRERNYIYLLDCTQSMEWNKIWDTTKAYLRDDINRIASDETSVHIVPFQTGAHPIVSFEKKNFDWDKTEKALDEYIKTKTKTGIVNAWDAGTSKIDPAKDNYFFLLTDGEDNVDGMDKVCQRIRTWCESYPNSYGFYVMLCDEAENEQLRDAANVCNRFSLIDANGHPQPIGSFYPSEIRVNTREMTPKRINFSDGGRYPVRVECDDPLFSVDAAEGFHDGIGQVTVKPKLSMKEIHQQLDGQETYTFRAKLIPDGDIILTDSMLVVEVVNKPERSLNLIAEEADMGKADYYPAFLFSKSSGQDTLHLDLKAKWNEESKNVNAKVRMKCELTKGEEGYTLLYNGQPCEGNTFTMTPGDAQSDLAIVFDENAPTGKRYFRIAPSQVQALDNINDELPNQWEQTFRAKYTTSWNPLKTILMWTLLIALAALLLWLCMLKNMQYPTFRLNSLQIFPPDSPSVSKKVRGCKKVVLTSHAQKQSFLSKLFTNTIIYVVNPAWTQDIELVPSGKGARLRTPAGAYSVNPPAVTLKQRETYEIVDQQNRKKTTITLQ